MRNNESEVFEYVVRLFENDLGVARSHVSFPQDDWSAPPVEMRLRIGERMFALEHALIESFQGAIEAGNVESRCLGQIERALDSKFPQLAACAALGDVTILALEYSDSILSNETVIANALEMALADRDFRPDHVFLVATGIEQEWHIHQVMAFGSFDNHLPRTAISRPSA